MILGIEHEAADRQARALLTILDKLDDAKRDAEKAGLRDVASDCGALIRKARQRWDEAHVVIVGYERQESGREATRALPEHARARMGEQLMLAPRPRPQVL